VQSDDCFGQEASRFQRKRLQKECFLPEYRHPRGLHWFCIACMPKACFFFRISAESERRQKNLLISLFMALLLKLFVVQYQ